MNIDKSKVIFHIDIDSFFVSSELTLRPEYKKSDIAISVGEENSIVSSLSYSAKEKGAKVPMKLKDVKQLCPNLVVFRPNFDLYSKLSNKIYDFIKNNYTQIIEIGSIDEWFLDVTNEWKKYKNVINMAKHIQNEIKKNFNLDTSVGISYNKFLAKMSTDLNKPFGITITRYEDIEKNFWNLKINNYWGIGKTIEKKLQEINIYTIGQLAKANKNDVNIKKIFKNQVDEYINNANGIGCNKINTNNSFLRLINNSKTFYNGPTNNTFLINNLIRDVAIMVEQRLNERSLQGNKISIQIKNHKITSQSVSKTLPIAISDFNSIYEHALYLFNLIWDGDKISGIGIQIHSLKNIYSFHNEISLFEENNKVIPKINQNVANIINKLNNIKNKKTLYTAKEYSENKSINKSQSKYIK